MANRIICSRAHPWVNKCKERNLSRRLSVTIVMTWHCYEAGYDLASRKGLLNYLLFMANFKLYGKNEKQVDTLINTVRVFSSDIAMEFGISKCAVLVMTSGKVSKCEGIRMPDAQVIRGLEEGDRYKYLGILEADDLKHAHMKEAISKEYT